MPFGRPVQYRIFRVSIQSLYRSRSHVLVPPGNSCLAEARRPPHRVVTSGGLVSGRAPLRPSPSQECELRLPHRPISVDDGEMEAQARGDIDQASLPDRVLASPSLAGVERKRPAHDLTRIDRPMFDGAVAQDLVADQAVAIVEEDADQLLPERAKPHRDVNSASRPYRRARFARHAWTATLTSSGNPPGWPRASRP